MPIYGLLCFYMSYAAIFDIICNHVLYFTTLYGKKEEEKTKGKNKYRKRNDPMIIPFRRDARRCHLLHLYTIANNPSHIPLLWVPNGKNHL